MCYILSLLFLLCLLANQYFISPELCRTVGVSPDVVKRHPGFPGPCMLVDNVEILFEGQQERITAV